MRKRLYIAALVILSGAKDLRGQAWSGILDSSRATDWTQAGFTIVEPASQCANQSGSYSPVGGGLDDAANINRLIFQCTSGGYILLASGTFTLSSAGLNYGAMNNVVLHGIGPDKTILLLKATIACGQKADVCFKGSSGWAGNYPGSTTWTAGYSKGTTVITLGSASGLSTTPGASGNIVILDQRDDSVGICPAGGGTGPCSGVSGATESGTTATITTSIPHGFSVGQPVGIGGVGVSGYNSGGNPNYAWWTISAIWNTANSTWNTTPGFSDPKSTKFQYTASAPGLAAGGGGYATVDTGGIYVNGVRGATIGESASIGRTCPDTHGAECTPGEISRRSQMEFKRITAINGNQVTITPPIEMPNWRAGQNPGIYWTGKYAIGDGIENVTLDYSSDGKTGVTGGIVFLNAYQCWAKNIRSINGNRNHVWIKSSAKIDVLDSYFFGTKGGGSKSYGVEIFTGGSDDLIQNNICQHVVACLMTGGSTGSVFSYNYAVDSGYSPATWLMPLTNENHDSSAMNLYEGNDTPAVLADNIHGTGALATALRNRFRGQDLPVRTNNLAAATDRAFCRAMNYVGNILGTVDTAQVPGETQYQINGTIFPSGYIWRFDSQDESGSAFTVPDDPLAHQTALRWGNYDVVTGAVRWCGNSSDTGWSTTCSSTTEIPGAFTYINANGEPTKGDIGAGQAALPSSFYLAAQPTFWTMASGYGPTPPWPAIGPDVTGGTAPDGVAGYSYSIPAQLCYQNTAIDPAYQNTYTVSGATWASGTATLTTSTNTLAVNNTVTVSGVNPSGFNGTFSVAARTSTTISYALPTNPGTYVSGGTVTYPNIRLFNAANCYAIPPAVSVLPPTLSCGNSTVGTTGTGTLAASGGTTRRLSTSRLRRWGPEAGP